MDSITSLPTSEGKSVIMVVVDRLTQYAHFCALSHPFKARTIANTFVREFLTNNHKAQPYKQMSLKQDKKDDKLSPKYYGSYKVLQNIGTMAYKFELPSSFRVHTISMFHA